MTDSAARRRFLGLLAILCAVSLLPLLVLDLNTASQLAGTLAFSFSAALAALPLLPKVRKRTSPLPWRRYSMVAAAALAVFGLGALGYAVWDNTRDIEVSFPGKGKPDDPPWRNGSYTLLDVPGAPPARTKLTMTVSLTNVQDTGDCERTAMLDFIPVLDGRQQKVVTGSPQQPTAVPLDGVRRDAAVKVVLRYDADNVNCAVRLHIDKAVLNG
ncbi:hypothetical protein [Amycolatopsis sp. NPDC021455]|uniref:hypothetical protein n=1 Tax=Amycolatopsis sp. NPDC021455 TaxID=3154901 RepID=UPI0033C472E4